MMRFRSTLFAAASAVAIVCSLSATPALAQASLMQETKIAVADVQVVMSQSTAMKAISDQMNSKLKAYQSEFEKKQTALRKEEQELIKQRTALTKEAFEEKVKSFQGKEIAAQKDAAETKAKFDNAYGRAMGQVQKAAGEIATDLAKEKGFAIALVTSQLLYADPSLNITDDVLARLNKKLPNVTVTFDK